MFPKNLFGDLWKLSIQIFLKSSKIFFVWQSMKANNPDLSKKLLSRFNFPNKLFGNL